MALPVNRLGSRLEPSFSAPVARSGSLSPSGDGFPLGWPSPQLWGLFGGWTGSSGMPITPLSSLQAAAAYRCIKVLSDDIGKLPMQIKRRLPGGGATVDTSHPLNALLAKPNDWQTPSEFRSYMTVGLAMRGNAFAAIKRGLDGAPLQLIPLNPDRVAVMISGSGRLYYNVSHPQIGDGVTLQQEDMIHLKGMSVDGGYLGLSPIAIAQDVFGLAISAQQHGAVLFRQGAQLGGVLSHPGKLSAEAAKRIGASWREQYGGVQNSSKVAVLEEGMKFEKLQMTNEDAQFLESRKFSVIEICRIFGVPPHKVFDLADAHYNNVESQNQQYKDDSLQPICTGMEQSCNSRLLFSDEVGTLFFETDYSALLRADQKTRYDTYQLAINNGILSRNEVRRMEGLPPVPGGDDYYVPLNMAVAGAAPAASPEQDDAALPAPPSTEPPADGDLSPLHNTIESPLE